MTYISQDVRSLEQAIAIDGSWRGRQGYIFQVMGRRPANMNSTSVWQDIKEFSTTVDAFNPGLASGSTQISIVSDDVDDDGDPADTGARTVHIAYINSSGDLAEVTVTMNGQTIVNTTLTTAIKAILFAEVDTVGSNAVAEGNISIFTGTATNGVPDDNTKIYEYIKAGGNRSLSSHFYVPTGYKAYVPRWSISQRSTVSTTTCEARLRSDTDSYDRSLDGGAMHFQDTYTLISGEAEQFNLPFVAYPAGATLKVSALPSAVACAMDCSYTVILLEDA